MLFCSFGVSGMSNFNVAEVLMYYFVELLRRGNRITWLNGVLHAKLLSYTDCFSIKIDLL